MSASGYRHIDERNVASLLRELGGDVRAAARFIHDFTEAWPTRVARLLEATERQDPEEVSTVVLSILSSSAMLGADDLSRSASDLQSELVATHRVDRHMIARFVENGTATCAELLDLAHRLESAPV